MAGPGWPTEVAQAMTMACAAILMVAVGLGVVLVAGDDWVSPGWPLFWNFGLPALLLVAGTAALAVRRTAVVLILGAVSLTLPTMVLSIITAAHALNGRAAGFLTAVAALAHALLVVWIVRLCRSPVTVEWLRTSGSNRPDGIE